MAILWQKTRAGTRYEVRAAGATRRLYTNGVLHSAFNPNHASTGDIWDLLMVPALTVPKVRSVLILGLGGGSVIHLLNRYATPEKIIAIERDPVHLQVARRFFKADAKNVQLIEADAIAWLHKNKRRYDVVIDDLFGHARGVPERALKVDTTWMGALNRAVSERGVLVMNFDSAAAHRAANPGRSKTITKGFASGIRLATDENENVVTAFFHNKTTPSDIKRHLESVPALDPRRASTRLRCQLRALPLTGRRLQRKQTKKAQKKGTDLFSNRK